MKITEIILPAFLSALLLGASASKAAVVTLQQGVDGYSQGAAVSLTGPTNQYYNWLYVRSQTGGGLNTSLFKFSGLDTLLAGTTVESATLTIYNVGSSSANTKIELREVLVPWLPNQATRDVSLTGVPWEAPGALGADDSTILSTTSLLLPAPGPIVLTLPISLVQSWIDSPATNYGVLLAIPEGSYGLIQGAGNFYATATNRPLLTITTTAVPEPSVTALLAAATAGSLLVLRRRIKP